ncbi:hypothetical protein BHE74_00033978 [Ensete ventricosum]|nr:hypothetical protein BHE74_00033978 [Ensete ventricosum]RZR96704.1 hypothetical protein BHM03_00025767 [Ensete ventricosum]
MRTTSARNCMDLARIAPATPPPTTTTVVFEVASPGPSRPMAVDRRMDAVMSNQTVKNASRRLLEKGMIRSSRPRWTTAGTRWRKVDRHQLVPSKTRNTPHRLNWIVDPISDSIRQSGVATCLNEFKPCVTAEVQSRLPLLFAISK